jgi:hypothetical protein
MTVITKILLTILIICGGAMLTQLFVQSMGNKVSSGGIGPFIIYPAMIAGVVAVWKYKPNKEGNNDLDKS